MMLKTYVERGKLKKIRFNLVENNNKRKKKTRFWLVFYFSVFHHRKQVFFSIKKRRVFYPVTTLYATISFHPYYHKVASNFDLLSLITRSLYITCILPLEIVSILLHPPLLYTFVSNTSPTSSFLYYCHILYSSISLPSLLSPLLC